MKKPSVRTFDFSKIPKLSRRQVSITQALLARYPQFYFIKEQNKLLTDKIAKELNSSVKINFVNFEEIARTRFIENLASPCTVIELTVEPFQHKMLLSFDYLLSRYIIQQLLGVQGVEIIDQVAFSDTEKGIFEYFLISMLMSIPDFETEQGEIAFRLSKLGNEAKLFAQVNPQEELGVVLKIYLAVGNRGGYINLYLPHPLVEGVLLKAEPIAADEALFENVEFEKQLNRVSHIKTSLWSEVGRVGLSLAEIQQLEKGDVVLFDETLMHISHGLNISGKAILRVGESQSPGGLLAEVIDAEGKLVLKILDYYGGPL